jgi:hypothetical protein
VFGVEFVRFSRPTARVRRAEWQGKAEREGYGWKVEGEGQNRYGQKVEAEGYRARGYYGSGVVADVEGGNDKNP